MERTCVAYVVPLVTLRCQPELFDQEGDRGSRSSASITRRTTHTAITLAYALLSIRRTAAGIPRMEFVGTDFDQVAAATVIQLGQAYPEACGSQPVKRRTKTNQVSLV